MFCYNIMLLCIWRCAIYAIIESGGKQYKVAPGETVDVDLMDKAEGDKVELDKVLLIRMIRMSPSVSRLSKAPRCWRLHKV